MSLTPSEVLLQELGITDPEEIDAEAIAWHVGVTVNYRHLDGCEAHILGYGNRAVVTVHSDRPEPRRRFSLAHELGHWHHHRGRAFICRAEEIGGQSVKKPEVEKVADAYAANLLMPWYLFSPKSLVIKKPSFGEIKNLADIFKTSFTATAIRYVESNTSPVMIVCHGRNGRKWFKRSRDIPERWFPRDELDADSYAFDVLFGDKGDHAPALIDASAWFDRREAERYEMREQTVSIGNGEILTLLLITDEEMLAEISNKQGWRRS
ncbi:MAG TPA: ImmA/IrrE family metallo-endopeptidase [Thiobacillus sp.]